MTAKTPNSTQELYRRKKIWRIHERNPTSVREQILDNPLFIPVPFIYLLLFIN